MSSVDRQNDSLTRHRPSDYFPVCAAEAGTFYMDDHSLGAVFFCTPYPGGSEDAQNKLRAACSLDFPSGTLVQCSQFSVAEISDYIQMYEGRRQRSFLNREVCDVLVKLTEVRINEFQAGLEVPPIKGHSSKIITAQMVVSIKIPLRRNMLDNDEEAEIVSMIRKFQEGLEVAKLYPVRLDTEEYLIAIRKMFNPFGKPVDWAGYDDTRELNEQILGPGTTVDISKNGFKINDVNVRVLSVKRLPRRFSIGTMGYLLGDPNGLGNQFSCPYLVTTTLYYPDQVSKLGAVRAKAQAIRYQAFGPALKYVPILGSKKEGMDVLLNAVDEQSEKVVEMTMNIALFSLSEEELDKNIGMAQTYYKSFDLHMGQERRIVWPVFLNMLPLFPSEESRKSLHRINTLAVRQATQFLPVIGEWRGTGDGAASLLLTRRNQPLLFDFYDSRTSYNAVLFAEAGAGKSVLTQFFLTDYLTLGRETRAWVIDIGRSYYKLCKIVGGEFIEFREDSKICINPFSYVTNLSDEMNMLKALLAKMAAPNQGLEDDQFAMMEEAITAVFNVKAQGTTVTDIAEYLNRQPDPMARSLGRQLFPFCRGGSYARWFEGEANLDFSKQFVVLEMEELALKPHLCQVVLMQLVAKIQFEMCQAGKGVRKLLWIDESYKLLDDPVMGIWLAEMYRRVRKEEGCCMIVTQSIADLYKTPAGVTIADNSPFKLIMQQPGDAINTIQKDGRLELTDYGFQQMKTVHTLPGKYSEVMLYTPNGVGIARLTLDKFRGAVYSTKGAARHELIERIRDSSDPIETINEFIAEVA